MVVLEAVEGLIGRVDVRVTVLGETPDSYRVRYDEASYAGKPGTVELVPKHTVVFDPIPPT